MNRIAIDFGAGLGKWRRVMTQALLATSLVAVIVSVLLLVFGSVKLGSYFMVRSDNQPGAGIRETGLCSIVHARQ